MTRSDPLWPGGERHLRRYLAEFDFRFNRREMDDFSRSIALIKGATGKRLRYKTVSE